MRVKKLKIISNSFFWIGLFISILTEINKTNYNYKYFIAFQIIFVLFYILIDMKKAFLYHILFMLMSTTFLSDLRIKEIAIQNYSKLKLYGPISYSTIILLIFFCLSLYYGMNNRKINLRLRYLRKFITIFFIFFIYPIINGIIGILFRENYNVNSFITYGIYSFYAIIYIITIISIFNNKDYELLKNFIFSLFVIASLFPIITGLLDIRGFYGGIKRLPFLDYNSFLTILIFYDNIILRLSFVFYILTFKYLSSGQAIIFFIITFFSYFMKKSKKVVCLVLISSIFIIVYRENIIEFLFTNRDTIFYYKIRQVSKVFEFWNLDEMPRSPKIRISELLNIIMYYYENFLEIFLGVGFGGVYTDKLNLFSGLELEKGGFSSEIVKAGYFPNSHTMLFNILFFNGIVGFYFIFKYIYFFFKKISYSPLSLVTVIWLFYMIYFNLHILIFSLLITYYVFIEIELKEKKCTR